MTGAAAHLGLTGLAAEDGGRVEREVAEIDQIGLSAADRLGMKEFAWPRQRVLGKFGAGRQHGLVAAERERRRAQWQQGNDKRQQRDPHRSDATIARC